MRSNFILRSLLSCVCLLAAAICAAQSAPSTDPEWVGNQLSIVSSPTQQVITAIAWRSAGNPGLRTLYYWIVANGASDSSSPAGPFPALNAPDVLSASTKVTVSWQPVSGATSYDVLRTSTNQAPGPNCNCAVTTGVTSTSVDDTSEALQNYNPSSMGKTAFTLTNEQYSSGVRALRVRFQGKPVFDWRSDGSLSISKLTAGTTTPTKVDDTGVTFPDGSTQNTAAVPGISNPMTTLGDVIYGGATGVPTRLAGNTSTTKKVLASQGNGSSAQAPSFIQLASGDLSDGSTLRKSNIAPFFPGQMTDAQFLYGVAPPTGTTYSIASGCANSNANATIAATASTTVTIYKCTAVGYTTCSSVGTIVFAASGKTGTYTCSSAFTVNGSSNESMYFQGPATHDSTLANVSISLEITR